jgi:ParB family chromosome partitioning protein
MTNAQPSIIYEKGKLYDIPLADLQADPDQPRKVIDPLGLEDITASIAKLGVLQPILFRTAADGTLIIVAGERRVTAASAAGLATVPALYIADANYAEVALVENLLRQDLTAVEEAEALQRLMTEQSYTQEQMGVIVGKARTTVGDILTLNKLPLEIRDECRGDRIITRKTLIEIARKKQLRGMTTAYNSYKTKLQKGKTVRQKKVPNDPATLLDVVVKLTEKIRILDNSAWSADDVALLRNSFLQHKEAIDAYLATLPAVDTAV